jgi:hypothetical protein
MRPVQRTLFASAVAEELRLNVPARLNDHSITIGSEKDKRQDGSIAVKRFDRRAHPERVAHQRTHCNAIFKDDRVTLLRPLRKTPQRNKH